ncbi:MAG TPA: hypothetical protein VEU96_09945 [Bryobacteraceae bacterium]|nr:hypothetical protein [Bryobacteraceae bacterium]
MRPRFLGLHFFNITPVLLAVLLPCIAPADDKAAFAAWWPHFQAAVAGRDAHTVARGVQFPLNWENGKIREIKTEADLANNFDTYFTAEIRKLIAARKPERMPNGVYSITWKARGNEYSIYFKPGGAGNFILDGLSEGPP